MPKWIRMISGILLILLGVVFLLAAFLFRFAAAHTMDGTAALYHRQILYMWIALAAGILSMICGILRIVRR